MDARGYSPNLSYQLVWLSGLVPFAQARQILEEVGQWQVATTTLWEQVPDHGERLQNHVVQIQAHVSVERTRWQSENYDPKMTRCVSMDGGMVCLRDAGWQEKKVGLVSDPACVKLIEMDYCAVIGDLSTFDPALWALAVKHHVPYAGRLVVVCDGAAWIWRLVADLFPVCHQIVDYYPAKQQVAKLAQELYPNDDACAHTWFNEMSNALSTVKSSKLSLIYRHIISNPATSPIINDGCSTHSFVLRGYQLDRVVSKVPLSNLNIG